MKAKLMPPAFEWRERKSVIVTTTLNELVSAVEREMEAPDDKEVAAAVSAILSRRRLRGQSALRGKRLKPVPASCIADSGDN